ncbi:hypothetical protein, partial [Nocardia wallacei]|uniref:hypothetical protein n=1 Tax=Nocardia wallacei TaxID=480035 RepID=UPI002456BBBC
PRRALHLTTTAAPPPSALTPAHPPRVPSALRAHDRAAPRGAAAGGTVFSDPRVETGGED